HHLLCKKDYEDYCDLLFKEYGSKVKKWITLNEPMGTTRKAYDEGVFAPGHCSPWVNRACRVGDSGIEPYIVAHNLLLAHSAALPSHVIITHPPLSSHFPPSPAIFLKRKHFPPISPTHS
ncbi:Beta-glucosidase 14, partial [Linum perenne]